jgi:hypothetical protein
MSDIYTSDGTPAQEVTVTLKLLVRKPDQEQMARDIRRVLASRKALKRVLNAIVTIGVEGPGMITRNRQGIAAEREEPQAQELCHVYAECPGCAVALAPDATHAEGCEWLASVQAGVKAVHRAMITPWSEVEQELDTEEAEPEWHATGGRTPPAHHSAFLGHELEPIDASQCEEDLGSDPLDATQRDNPPEDTQPPDELGHLHTCPSDGTEFPCMVRHPSGTLTVNAVITLCPLWHRGVVR